MIPNPLLVLMLLGSWKHLAVVVLLAWLVLRQIGSGRPKSPPEPRLTLREMRRNIGGQVAVARMSFAAALDGRALLSKELMLLLRSRKAYWFMVCLSAAVSGFFLLMWRENAGQITVASRAFYSRQIFKTLFFVQYCGLGTISALMAATSVTSERESRTLDLLLVTGLSRYQVMLAKWLSTAVFQAALTISLLPVMALSFQLGGVGLGEYVAAAILTLAGIAAGGMVGMAVSCRVDRTIPSMLVTLLIVGVVESATRTHNYFDWYDRAGTHALLFGPLVVLGIVFWAASVVAWQGLVFKDTMRIAVSKPVIHDPVVIEMRRREYPYYLIDPMASAEPIPDGANPAYVKESRINPLGRLDVIIRVCYLAMALSFFVILANRLRVSLDYFRDLMRWESLFLLLFAPVLAATALSREYDEGTAGLLSATLLTPRQIVWGKFFVAMRVLGALCLSMAVMPAAIPVGMSLTQNGFRDYDSIWNPLGLLARFTPMLAAFAVLFAAIGLLCSSLARRNVAAIVASYVAMLALAGSPNAAGFISDLLGPGGGWAQNAVTHALRGFSEYVAPLLSPFLYFSATIDASSQVWNAPDTWKQTGWAAGLIVLLTVMIVEAAVCVHRFRLRRR